MFLSLLQFLYSIKAVSQIPISLILHLNPEKSSLVHSWVIHEFSLCSITACISGTCTAGYNCLLISFAYLQ